MVMYIANDCDISWKFKKLESGDNIDAVADCVIS